MKKVLLVSTPLDKEFQLGHIPDRENSYSLGQGYLHSSIERAGYKIITKNYNTAEETHSMELIKEEIRRFSPDYLLVQIFTVNRVTSYELIRLAREIKHDLKIVVGGIHTTVMYEQLLNNFDIDYAVIGEGEITIVELLQAIDQGLKVERIKGIAYKSNDLIIRTQERELLADLDKLPFPKHELFITKNRSMACIITSRGCPFKCSFCCLQTVSKGIYRKRSVENIIAEIEYILNSFKQVNLIQIVDDTFTLDEQRVIDFCNEVIRRKLRVKFWGSGRIKPASEKMFKLMEEAGFTWLGFGLETGCSRLLQSIHKEITKDDVRKTFSMLRVTKKMEIGLFMMVGFPGENMDSIRETVEFLQELYKIRKFSVRGVAILWVLPNTEIYEYMKSRGLIDNDYWLKSRDIPRYTAEHSIEELHVYSSIIQMRFYSYGGKLNFILTGMGYFLRSPVKTIRKIINNSEYLFMRK